MPSKKIFIHIGAPKTGTTYIQNVLMNSEAALNGCDFAYPDVCKMYAGHHKLAFAMKGRADPRTGEALVFEEQIESFLNFTNELKVNNILISSEEFFSCSMESIETLKHALAGFQTKIIASVRRSDEFFLSSYNERMKKHSNNFSYSVKEAIEDKSKWPDEMFFKTNIERWLNAFPIQDFSVNSYETGDPLEALLSDLDITGCIETQSRRINESRPAKAVALIRLMKLSNFPMESRTELAETLFDAFADDNTPMLSYNDRKRIILSNREELSGVFEYLKVEDPYANLLAEVIDTGGPCVSEIHASELISEAEKLTGINLGHLRTMDD